MAKFHLQKEKVKDNKKVYKFIDKKRPSVELIL